MVAFCATPNIANLFDRDYFFVPLAISAALAFVPGGEIANPGGECAPEASSGLEVAIASGASVHAMAMISKRGIVRASRHGARAMRARRETIFCCLDEGAFAFPFKPYAAAPGASGKVDLLLPRLARRCGLSMEQAIRTALELQSGWAHSECAGVLTGVRAQRRL